MTALQSHGAARNISVTWHRFATVLLRLSLAVCVASLPASPAKAEQRTIAIGNGSVSSVAVRPGSTMTIATSQPFANLVVGDVAIADVVPLSDRTFYIQAIGLGTTNISIYDGGDRLLGVVDTRVRLDMGDVSGAIRAGVPSARVNVTNLNDRVHLSGTVRSAPDVLRVVEIAQQYSADPVINAIAVTDAQQVSLEVRVLEARRTAGRDLGINFRARGGTSLSVAGSRLTLNANEDGDPQAYLTENAGRNSQGTPFGSMIAQVLESAGVRVDAVINALEKKGLARRLAQPNLTTVSGEKASFHAGGEVPIQSAVAGTGGVAATQTDYRPYGVRLEFLPTVLDDGLVNLRVTTEVSEIDPSIIVNGNPGFTSRKAQTVIELRDGQSFALAGLLQTVNSKTIEQMPWIGNVPVLGALFRSVSFQKQETDLVIVVTPRIVRPAAAGQALASPLDQTRSPNDVELFGMGLLEVDRTIVGSVRRGEGVAGPYGHFIDFEEGGADAESDR
ncbi:type II and III secretion system protein family protein [Fulvimarina sp. 2208YS6-2-32]|uniref:Type II and III secretion system protein family protein n=1 Tax=Fulvimarina uroteuthidis TaxID=3098149 RepID=A0ABU5I4I6_9HYPH|nr:type II and III secretion system protein family protein [Fulvimarina sp. 2208YS6-2-32]MDY8110126.1 type II and III secretion system protein family protein [Fulvimarina sp. 2208YS6-2-32]